MEFSVLMSVYKSENAQYFRRAMESVLQQTLLPNQIVLVRDGQVPDEVQKVVDEYAQNGLVTYLPLEENVGLGNALNLGLQQAKYDWVARMDTDDVCLPDRFEKQVAFIQENPTVAVVGCQIAEFIGEEGNVISERKVPCAHEEISVFIKARNPFNHQSVFFRKEKIMAAGGYQDLHFLEDYYLWCRVYNDGGQLANLPDVLVQVRVGEEMYKRRGGWNYFKSFRRLEKYKKQSGMISGGKKFKNLCMRFVQTCTPNFIRKWGYNHLARKQVKK